MWHLSKHAAAGAHSTVGYKGQMSCSIGQMIGETVLCWSVSAIYTVSGKKEATLFSTTTLAYLGRFLSFVYHWKQEWILYNYV